MTGLKYYDRNIVILAGGISVRQQGVTLGSLRENNNFVIGVNSAALYADCDCLVSSSDKWITEMYDKVNEELPYLPKFYSLQPLKKLLDGGTQWHPSVSVFGTDKTTNHPSKDESILNGVNSAACALNLALQRRPKTIYLFGFDMKPSVPPYWYTKYNSLEDQTGKVQLNSWAKSFKFVGDFARVNGINILNVNPQSDIPEKDFNKIDYQTYLKLLRQ